MRMTIDEAIIHAREVASRKFDDRVHCIRCAEEHEQLAKWLEELKVLRHGANELRSAGYEHGYSVGYNKAIDDIKEKLMQNGFIYTQHALDVFNEIAEQLKAGDEE